MNASNIAAAATGELEIGICGKCDTRNAMDAKFCGGCGQPLRETCGHCSQQVPLGQKFCAGCGHHLKDQLHQSLQQIAAALDDAERAMAAHDFPRAAALAGKHIQARDYRFDELAAQARAVLQRAEQAAAQWRERLEEAERQSRAAADRGDHAAVIEAVQGIPRTLLANDLRRRVAASSAAMAELKHLRTETKQALAAKDYVAAGVRLNQLLQLCPASDNYRKSAAVVAEQLCRQAEQFYAANHVSRAVQHLQAVPLAEQQSERYQQLRRRVDALAWMIDQVSNEPLMTPVLLGICKRMAEQMPEDRRTVQLVQRAAELRKTDSTEPRCPFPAWNSQPVGWRAAPVAILAQPQAIELDGQGVIRKHRARFSVALGLALQGCGSAAFDLSLGSAGREGKLSRLFRRKAVDVCWGVDAGSTGCRAVLLRRDGPRWVAERAWQAAYPEPLCRPTMGVRASLLRREMLQKFMQQCQPGDTPVWVNLPGREIISRFLQLPPINDKLLAPLLEKEVTRQLSDMRADLVVRHWVCPEDAAEGSGRAAAVVAAKRSVVQQTLETFAELGMAPAGIQCEPLALANFLAHEFSAPLAGGESAARHAYALVDAGAQSTSLVALTSRSVWFRTFDGGGEDLTAKIAKRLKVSLDQAEHLKREPLQADDPAALSEAIEPPMQAMGMRLETAYGQSPLASDDVALQAVHAVGGNVETLGWLRHVLCRG